MVTKLAQIKADSQNCSKMAMNRAGIILSGVIVTYVFCIIALFPKTVQADNSKLESTAELKATSAQSQLIENYGKIPLHFEANRGQTEPSVKFLARGSGYGFFLAPTEAVMSLKKPKTSFSEKPIRSDIQAEAEKTQINNVAKSSMSCASGSGAPCDNQDENSTAIHMRLLGGNPAPHVVGIEELPGKANYFQGNDPKEWHTDVPTYAKVKYQAVYPGIDLIYYGNQNQLEYDFIVAPGANPKAIKFGFAGIDITASVEPHIDSNGDLIVSAEGGEVRWKKPAIYQDKSGQRKAVEGKFVIADNQVSFQVAAYDKSQPLVIDPVLVYSTYLGGNGSDIGKGIAVDKFGNVYLTGQTRSTNFPLKNSTQKKYNGGQYDAFVAKLNKAGSSLVYSTYLGGSNSDFGNDIAVDGLGNAYVTGTTLSRDFPTKNALQKNTAGSAGSVRGSSDGFVIKLNATGSIIVYSTYLGGFAIDEGNGIAVDKSGNAYVTGMVYIPNICVPNLPLPKITYNFPTTTNAFQPDSGCQEDAFVTKINPNGTAFVYSSYLGGDNSREWGFDIAVDQLGNAYVTGEVQDPLSDFPAINPFQKTHHGGIRDAFISKINASGTTLVYSTYLGGSKSDVGLGIAVDTLGNAYVTGTTRSLDFPLKNALQKIHGGGGKGSSYENDDAFITKINQSGTALIYSTYLGGKDPAGTASGDGGQGIAVDRQGQAYVTGYTTADRFPTKLPIQKAKGGPGSDAFVTKLNKLGTAFVYSTYLGGIGTNGDAGYAIAVDSLGQAYITGEAGSAKFPTKNPLQKANKGLDDAFITKISK